MSLRINFNLAGVLGHANLSRTDRQLSSVMSRLSSGLRLQRAADDPAGLVIANGMRHIHRGMAQATSNAEEGVSLLQTADGSMDEIGGLLNRMRSLAVAAANEAVNDPSQLAALQDEFDNAVASVTQIADGARFGSLALLGGDLADFTLSADAEEGYGAVVTDATRLPAGIMPGSTLSIGAPSANLAHERVAVTLDTDLVAGGYPAATTPLTGLFQNGAQLTVAGGTTLTVAGPRGARDIVVTSANTIADFVALVNTATTATGVRAAYDQASGELALESVGFGSGTVSITGADLTGGGNVGLLDGDTTAASSNPLHAVRDTFSMTLNNGGPLATATDAILGLTDAGTGSVFDTVDGKTMRFYGVDGEAEMALTTSTTIQDVVDFVNGNALALGARASFDALTGTLSVVGERGPLRIAADEMTTLPTGHGLLDRRTDLPDSAGTVQLSTAANATLDVEFTDASGQLRTVTLVQDPTSEGGLDFVNLTPGPETAPPYSGWEAGALRVRMRDTTAGAFGGTVTAPTAAVTAERTGTTMLQIGASEGQVRIVDLPDMRAGALGFSAFRAEYAGSAATKPLVENGYRSLQDLVDLRALRSGRGGEAIRVIDAAIAEVTEARGRAGALQANGIETAIESLRISELNLISSESAIRDTDFALESANFTRLNIMLQAATAMLAQANQTPQSVLQLLQRQ